MKINTYKVQLKRTGSISVPVSAILGPDKSARVLRHLCGASPTEEMWALYVGATLSVVGAELIAKGALDGIGLSCRGVLQGALAANARGIILGHNHPSGDATPSPEDATFTLRVKAACEMVGLELIDHIVVTNSEHFYSLLGGGK